MSLRRISRLPKLGGLGRPRKAASVKPILEPRKVFTKTDLPPEIEALVAKLGERQARIVWKWKRAGVQGTAPELLVYDWLKGRKMIFQFQSSMFGGRRIRGGIVCDFIVQYAGGVLIWMIQGEHWHFTAEQRKHDKAIKIRLKASRPGGQKVVAMVELFENDIYKARNAVCEDALRGKERRT